MPCRCERTCLRWKKSSIRSSFGGGEERFVALTYGLLPELRGVVDALEHAALLWELGTACQIGEVCRAMHEGSTTRASRSLPELCAADGRVRKIKGALSLALLLGLLGALRIVLW